MSKPNISLVKPSRRTERTETQAALEASAAGTARVVISAKAHRALKIHCATTNRQMKEVLDELLAKAGFK